jgi:hypothetical protein
MKEFATNTSILLLGLLLTVAPVVSETGNGEYDFGTFLTKPKLAPDGRLFLEFKVHSPTRPERIDVEAVEIEGNRLSIFARVVPGMLPVVGYSQTDVVIDNLPAGHLTVRLMLSAPDPEQWREYDRFEVSVPEQRVYRRDPEIGIWPPDPTTLDRVWLLVEPLHTCGDFVSIDWIGYDRLELTEVERICRPGARPRLAVLPIPDHLDSARVQVFHQLIDGDGPVRIGTVGWVTEDRLTSRLSGSWHNPNYSGQGLTLQVSDHHRLLAYWFTHDPDGGLLWLVGDGIHQDMQATLDVVSISGGRFPVGDDQPVDLDDWGQLTLEFESCQLAEMNWDSEQPRFEPGSMQLHRLSAISGHYCDGPPPEATTWPDWYRSASHYFQLYPQ